MVPIPAPSPSREELILSLAPQVNYIVNKMYRKLPAFFDRDDVMIEAWIGAIQAVDRFDPTPGFKLKTFAELQIKGRILDFFTRSDFAGKAARRRIKAGKQEGPRTVGLSTVFHLVDPQAARRIIEAEVSHDVARILTLSRSRLTSLEYSTVKRVLSGVALRQIAKERGVRESRIYQVKQNAVVKMAYRTGCL